MRKTQWIQIGSMLFIIGLFVIFFVNLSSQADVVQVGDKAANFELEDQDGEVFQLADYQDKPVILYFFTTWCTSCKEQTPEMIAFQEEFGEDVHLLTIVRSESRRALERYIEKTDHTENQYLFDFNTEVSDQYGVMGQPETVIIDEEGVVVDHTVGPLTKSTLTEKMDALVY